MNTIRDAGTGRDTVLPLQVFDLIDGSSTGDPARNYAKSEPWRSDTSDPRGYNILTHGKAYNVINANAVFVGDPVSVEHVLPKYIVRVLRENETMISPPEFNLPRTTNTREIKTESNSVLEDISEARVEAKELVSAFLEEVRTDEILERCELAISDIIDRHGKGGIAALQAEVFEPTVEPLAWKFLNALGARRGQPIDDVARAILLGHLGSTSAGRRSAAATALGSFPDRVVLTALERRAAIETNRIVLATLKAHIRTLRRDALSTAKIL
jgi:hypothetical protein